VLETSQLWRQTVTRIALDYPEVKVEHLFVDACAMHLVTNPRRFDVIVTENLFWRYTFGRGGGYYGFARDAGIRNNRGTVDLYEPVHGFGADIAGKGIANPIGAIGSIAMMLRHTAKLEQEATDIEGAINSVLESGYRTAD